MQERIEVRFNPSNAEEGALVALLESQSDYGAKGRFLKARLLRGYVAILREVASIRAETDPLAALSRVAQSVNAGHYRVLRALLYQRPDAADASPRAPRAPRRAPRVESLDVPSNPSDGAAPIAESQGSLAQAAPEALPMEGPPRVAETPASRPPADATLPILTETVEAGSPAEPTVSAPEAAPVERDATPRVNWSSFAGVAGKRGL